MKPFSEKQVKLWNILLGWTVFMIAALTYILTLEPTASFWDCGEFISAAYKLEVGHPPGAPFFMILGNFFSQFASSPENVAYAVNLLSALASAFTILFLFWSITHLAKKIIPEPKELWQLIAVLGSGVLGALAYTFSDTFWFSAVEGEVYATSSFFTAVVFWAVLKWENEHDEKYANRWLIFIAYLMGLSIGVHLLNLLAIPAIVLVYYYRKNTFSWMGTLKALLLSVCILAAIMYIIIPYIPTFGAWFDRLFVNSFGLGFNSGLLFYTALLTGAVIYALRYTHKKKQYLANTIILAIAVVLIGYSSYAVIVIRANAHPPMNQNAPDNPYDLLSYINREQYGDRPLLSGQYFNAPVIDRKQGKPIYIKKEGKYVVSGYRQKLRYDPRFTTFFPRMWSNNEEQHIKDYKTWTNFKGKPVKLSDYSGNNTIEYVPGFGDNLHFFFKYQVGYMYLRYFMWNFAGRQNDMQGHGEITKGNWISGIKFIDQARLGDQTNLPEKYTSNKGRNTYYFIPLIFGLIGLIYQLKKSKNEFLIVSLLFIMTGFAIVVYLNQNPHQPRERDYAYAGSFYAFAIWIGLAVLALIDLLHKKLPKNIFAPIIFVVSLILVPGLLAMENWDDHDRSGRYTARDFAKNYLNSCEENAILFTNGDNDTFPLWYVQEVEGFRQDVRVANLSYLRADWYIDQMKRKAYSSKPLPSSMEHNKYAGSNRDYVLIIDRLREPLDLRKAMEFMLSDDQRTQMNSPFERGKMVNYFPSSSLYLPINKQELISKNVIKGKDTTRIVDTFHINFSKQYITKEGLALMDILASNNWERPVYYAVTVGQDNYFSLDSYFQNEGLSHRIVPIFHKDKSGFKGRVAEDIMYDNLMNKFVWGGIDNPDIYLDENNLRMTANYRTFFGRLAISLAENGNKEKALQVIERCLEVIPEYNIPHGYHSIMLIEALYKAGNSEDALLLSKKVLEISDNELEYYARLKPKQLTNMEYDLRLHLSSIHEILLLADEFKQNELIDAYQEKFNQHIRLFTSR